MPRLLCIGDATHAMSPIGVAGINLAIQDAVAAANRLHAPLRAGAPTLADLDAVQERRQPATGVVQRVQILIQNRLIRPVLGAARPVRVPWGCSSGFLCSSGSPRASSGRACGWRTSPDVPAACVSRP